MTRREVIKHMREAYRIHLLWARRQAKRRRRGERPVPLVGAETHHRKWCRVYVAAIKLLERRVVQKIVVPR